MHNKTSWGQVATWYNSLLENDSDSFQEKVIKPNLLRLVSAQKNDQILDLGCGQGFFSREFAKAGAFVTGIDIAKELLDFAKQRASKNEKYLLMSAEDLSVLKNQYFDKCVCVLALQNIAHYQATLQEISRVLKPSGKVVLVLNHPAFRIPGRSTWDFEPENKIQWRKIESYMSELSKAMEMNPGEKNANKKITTWSFHRPLQSYFKAFFKANLCVTRLEEWISHKKSDKGTRKIAEDTARKEIPIFICLELKKC